MNRETEHTMGILKQLSGELDAAEAKELKQWLAASSENQQQYETYVQLWQWITPPPAPTPSPAKDEWQRLAKHIGISLSQDTPRKVFSIWRSPLVVAAAAVVLLGLVATLWFSQDRTPTVIVIAGTAETSTVRLPDDSIVRLNSGSVLSYPRTFSPDERHVQLEGEAFFEVTTNDAPFVVSSEHAQVHVLGTVFNIWARGEETRVAVREGRVAVRAKTGSDAVILTANEAALCRTNQRPERLSGTYADDALDWLEGHLVFNLTPLPEVVAELSRSYGHPIQLTGQDLPQQTLTASFTKQPLEDILVSVCLTMACTLNQDPEGYTLTR